MMQRIQNPTYDTYDEGGESTTQQTTSDQLGHEFYNDDIYDYNEHFMRDNDEDDDEEDGPLAFGNQSTQEDIEAINEQDLLMMDTFFKKVDSLELMKPKKAKIIQNKYLIGELLGDGSYGKVKESLDIDTLCRRAVKIINLKNVQRKIPRGVQNVKKEISIMKRLNHKNVIKLYDVFEKNSTKEYKTVSDDPFTETSSIEKPPKLYIFMDYCMTSLEKLVKTAPNGRLSNRQANFYFKQLIDGLEYLHSLGIIHNDIKPGNLLITCDETLKICDFSISAQIRLFYDYDMDNFDSDYYDILNENTESKNQFPIIQCTPMFQCPEMLAENLDEKTIIYNACKIDVWSSGITLYQLTTGSLPFHGQTIHQIYESIRSSTHEIQIPSFIDKHLVKLLNGMLNRNPLDRWSIKQIRDSEWFKKKHPYIAEEYAQWPLDVIQNETGTYRMLQYLEKYCDELQSDNSQQQQQQQLEQTNHTLTTITTNNTTATSQLLHQEQNTSKFTQATKMKKNNCIIN